MSRKILKLINAFLGPAMVTLFSIAKPLFVFGRKSDGVQRIAIMKLVGLGDTVLILSILSLIKKSFPAVEIFAVTTPLTSPLFKRSSDVNRVIEYDILGKERGILPFIKKMRELRRLNIDHFLDFEQHYHLTPLLMLLTGATQRFALVHSERKDRAKLLTSPVPYDDREHMVYSYYGLYQSLCQKVSIQPLDPEKVLNYTLPQPGSEKEVDRVESWIKTAGFQGKLLVGIHAGSGGTGLFRRWPLERFAAVIQKLISNPEICIVLTGGPSEIDVVEDLAGRFQSSSVKAATGFSMFEFLALLSRIDCFLSNDTGPMHIASWLGTPTVGLFGPNTPERYGPKPDGNHRSLYQKVPCSPCINIHRGYVPQDCINPDWGLCMRRVEVEGVMTAISELIAGNR